MHRAETPRNLAGWISRGYATPSADILKAFSVNCLVGGTRFSHTRRLQDDGTVVMITGMSKGRLCGEDAFCWLCEKLDPAQVEGLFAPAERAAANSGQNGP